MPQNPTLADQLQIEPGTTTYGTRLIDRDPTDGGLRFADPNVTAALKDLVGTRNITGLFLVGRAGAGSPYTTIQDALDAVPDNSSALVPSLVLLSAGVYTENVVIEKDGVYLVGLGGVTITNAVADATVTIQEAPTSVPNGAVLRNLTVVNTDDAQACVFVNGANNYADGTATVVTAPLAAGDTLTIGGLPLTGVVGSRASGNDDFSVDGATADIIAAEIVAALNDTANSFAATVVATAVGAVITITAVLPGVGGNSITLAALTAPPGGITVSGGTLTGGGASGSTVGSEGIAIAECRLKAQGVGGYQVHADTVNNIRVQDGTWRGSSSTSKALITQVAAFRVHGLEWANDLELSYDSGADQPSVLTSVCEVSHCKEVGDVLSGLIGEGSLLLTHLGTVGDVAQGGDRTLVVKHCSLGTLTLNDTTAATLVDSPRGTASVGAGTPTLQESMVVGSLAFPGAPTVVPFPVDQPDTAYEVMLSPDVATAVYAVTSKTTASVTVTAVPATAATIGYTIVRQIPG
jgi:hypothetical protein